MIDNRRGSDNKLRARKHRVVWVLAFALLLAIQPLGAPAARAQTLPAYRIEASLDLDAGLLSARQSVRYRNATGQPLGSVVFRAVPAALRALTLGSATVDGQARAARLDGSTLEVVLDRPLAAGNTAEIELSYSISLPRGAGRLAATSRSVALGNWFPILAVHRGDWDRRQYVDVGDAFFTEVADYYVTLDLSRTALVAATGRAVEQGPLRWRFEALSVRDFAIAAAASWTVHSVDTNGTIVSAYAFGEQRARVLAQRGAKLVRWFGDRYGTYPYPGLAIVDVDLPASYGGMEYPGLVMLSTQYPLSADVEGSSLDTLLAHEVAHQWFYSWVGNDQIADPWLDEAMAQFIPTQFYAETRPDLYRSILDGAIGGAATGGVDTSVYDFRSDGPYYAVVYRSGGRFVAGLRDSLGGARFDELIRRYVTIHRDRLATPRAFLDLAQQMSPAELGPLIGTYFGYEAFRYRSPQRWSLEIPSGVWRGSADVFVGADFPVTRVELWLDGQRLADGPDNAVRLELAGVEPGEYVLLGRVWNHDGVLFERTARVEIAS
jgi:hypothetical protein